MERFRAYEGKQPYAFISYAHMDSDRVYEIISALNNDGFRIWYDQGIEIARRYKAVINEHIEKCSAFVVFATRNGIKREEVIDECAYAIALRKKMIIVYLEDIPAGELDAALRATFAINQRVMWGELADWERKYKLREALAECGGEPKAQPVMDSVETAQSAPAAAAAMAAPTAPKAEAVYSPLLERGFSLGKKGWAMLWILVGIYLLLPGLLFDLLEGMIPLLEFEMESGSAITAMRLDLAYSGGWHFPWKSIMEVFRLDGLNARSGLLVCTVYALLRLSPVIYAFTTKLNSSSKNKIYKSLTYISLIATGIQWIVSSIGGDFVARFSTIISFQTCFFAMARDFAVVAAGHAAVSSSIKGRLTPRSTLRRYTRIGILTLVICGVLASVRIGYWQYCEFGGNWILCTVACFISKLICFPWLALFLMKIAKDNAPPEGHPGNSKAATITVCVVSAVLVVLATVGMITAFME
ncbi:MAG: toll/interleukin-1 receptor domain-containing protein [Ruminococcaceae bacterium]|nr:toll/interleukin-1 receptor domain-containing protein [Oscillospiraceae bacterium]